ncbi:hypothetical protein [Ornithinicoccus halotolerans]|uniref:hypothetical protein n=1 Tax=Ornithinicoccus halotolerans TaxID=1748220 RepID=UPI001297AB03|nr:hypothetical protein [Ornithinicoccus halotolerans]
MTTRRALLRTPGGRLVAAVLTAVLGIGLGGCQLTSPMTTDMSYDPADGVSAAVGSVTVSNLLVVAESEGGPGRVSGLASNAGAEPVTVTIALEDRTEVATIELAPSQTVRLDGEPLPLLSAEGTEPVSIEEVSVPPGAFLTLRVGVEGGDTVSAAAPVLPPDAPYTGLAPEQSQRTAGQDG